MPDGADQYVRQAWERAGEWTPDAEGEPGSPDPCGFDYGEESEGGGGSVDAVGHGLPDGCPVVCLGVQGRVYYFLDALRQLQEVPWKDLQRSVIVGLFGADARDILRRHWPRKAQDKQTGEWVTTGWAPEEVQFDLAEGCARRGVWSPRARVRGAGAWKTPDGTLILHCGDRVYRYPAGGGRPQDDEPGVVGEFVYPAAPPTPRPTDDPQGADRRDGAAWQLLAILRTWNWRRKEVDPILMLGWICAAMVGGALKFRPMVWLPGEFGTGKSSLQDLIKWLMGTTGLLSVANATAAGIAQTLGYASLPAALDEQEASADGRKVTGAVELAREASTGAVRVRGSSDHEARAFNIQSAFIFSSILMPSMEPQDVSRFAVLELLRLPEGARPPPITEIGMGELGRKLLRRMVDGWPRFAATLEAYREALMTSGRHSGRGADLFGTLLACADLALADEMPSAERLRQWAERLDATKLAELDGAPSDKASCLNYMLTATLEDKHNRRERTIADWVARAHGEGDGGEEVRLHANEILRLHGLKYMYVEGFYYLAVSNSHQGVAALFRDTKWAASAGNNGVWRQSLGRIEGAIVGHQVKFPPNSRAVLVPLSSFLPGVAAPPGAAENVSAAGRSPGTAEDTGTVVDGASGRCAADAAAGSPPPVDDFDPFSLGDDP